MDNLKDIINLSDNNYLITLEQEIKWHDDTSITYKKRHTIIKLINIICTILISLCSIMALLFSIYIMPIIVGILAGCITLFEKVLDVKQYERLHIIYRNTCETLKREKRYFYSHVKPYDGSDLENITVLTKRCQEILWDETIVWTDYQKNRPK